MSVDQTNVVDAIGVDNQTGELVLTITDSLEWSGADKEHFLLLQDKLNTYLSFVESGEVLQVYPDAENRTVVIDVVCKYALSEFAVDFFARAEAAIRNAGMKLRYRQFGLV